MEKAIATKNSMPMVVKYNILEKIIKKNNINLDSGGFK